MRAQHVLSYNKSNMKQNKISVTYSIVSKKQKRKEENIEQERFLLREFPSFRLIFQTF